MTLAATSSTDRNEPLDQYRKLKLKYGGEISEPILRNLTLELRDIVPHGRYTHRGGSTAVCVSSVEYPGTAKYADDIRVVFGPLNGPTSRRLPVADFLTAYRFFAADCTH